MIGVDEEILAVCPRQLEGTRMEALGSIEAGKLADLAIVDGDPIREP